MMEHGFEPEAKSLNLLLPVSTPGSEPAPLIIPAYQRQYAWGPDQWGALWEDLAKLLHAGAGDNDYLERRHFVGNIVLIRSRREDGRISYEVADGQQRLTTFFVLLAALRNLYERNHCTAIPAEDGGEVAVDQRKALRNAQVRRDALNARISTIDMDGEHQPRLRALWDNDDTFRSQVADIDRSMRVAAGAGGTFTEALTYFTERLAEGAEAGQRDDPAEWLNHFMDTILNHTVACQIVVENAANAFALFESLNDRGLSLTAADLLRSHLLSRLEAGGDPDSVASRWNRLVDMFSENGHNFVDYLNYYLLATTETTVTKGSTYKKFQSVLSVSTVLDVLTGIENAATQYIALASSRHPGKSHIIPLVSALVRSPDTAEEQAFTELHRAAESLSLRWILTGGNAEVLKKAFAEWGHAIYGGQSLDSVAAEIWAWEKFPGDEAFRAGLVSGGTHNRINARFILATINSYIHSGGGEDVYLEPSSVHLEHVAPENPRSTLIASDGGVPRQDYWMKKLEASSAAEYNERVSQLGNYTLLGGKLNAELQDAPWSSKIAAYNERNKILMTRDLLGFDEWNLEIIESRTQWILDAACAAFSQGGAPVSFTAWRAAGAS